MDKFVWYVAGPFDHRPQVREIIAKIQAAGWSTNSRWAAEDNEDIAPDDPLREDKLRFQATRDVEDVLMADGLIYVNSKKSDGKATELGLSIATLKPIVIIGDRENNIFLNLNIPAFPTVEEMLTWLDADGQYYLKFVQAKQLEYINETQMEDAGVLGQMEFPSE